MGIMGKLSRIFTSSSAKWRAAQIEDIGYKMEMCSDISVKAVAEELMLSLSGGGGGRLSRSGQRQIIDRAEHLLDSVNTAEQRYLPLYNENFPLGMYSPNVSSISRPFVAWLKKSKSPLLNKFGKNVERVTHSVPRQVKNLAGSQEFETASRFNSMKRYISMYPEDTQTASHLWEKYYLSTLDADTSKILREIDSEFGVKLFMDRTPRKHELMFLREELANFKRASGGKAKFPPVIDLNNVDPLLRDNHFNGICVNFKSDKVNRLEGGRHITVDTMAHVYNNKVLRHEMAHYNDRNLGFRARKAKLSPQEKQEMREAGISSMISYAQKNSNEVKAVWAEGSMSKYSDAIKQKMIKKGLPEWITKLDDVSMEKYLQETFKDEKSLAILSEIKQACGGKIPNDLSIELLENPDKLEKAMQVLKIKDSHGYPALSVLEGMKATPERIKLIEKFANFEINGTKPYCDDIGVLLYEENFTLEQLQKLFAKVDKATQKGNTFELRAFYDRYFRYCEYIKAKQRSQKMFGNVTNVTRKSI